MHFAFLGLFREAPSDQEQGNRSPSVPFCFWFALSHLIAALCGSIPPKHLEGASVGVSKKGESHLQTVSGTGQPRLLGIGVQVLAWRNRRQLKSNIDSVDTVAKQSVEDGVLPYCAVHESKTQRLLNTFDKSMFPGLLCCHTGSQQGGQRLFSYWRSKAAYEQSALEFTAQLAQSRDALLEGPLLDFRREDINIWRKYQFWTVVITLSTLVGAVAGLWERIAQLSERPSLYVERSLENDPDVLTSDKKAIRFSVTNQCRFAPIKVDVKAAVEPVSTGGADPAGDKADVLANTPVKARLSRIEPGQTKEFYLREPSPDFTGGGESPSAHRFVLRLETTAGLWNDEVRIVRTAPFNVWRPFDASKAKRGIAAARTCAADGVLLSGLGGEATGHITVTAKQPFESVVASLGTLELPSQHFRYSDKKLSAQADFSIPGLKPFRPYRYEVAVHGENVVEECAEIIHNLFVAFGESSGAQK